MPTRTEDGELASPQLPESFSCDGIRAAGKAAVAIDADDLWKFKPEELWNCVETIGNIDWPLETKIEVWRLMEAVRSLPCLVQPKKDSSMGVSYCT